MSAASPAGLARLHDAMAGRVAKGEMPGMVTLVARGEDVHVDAIGVMAFGAKESMRRDTIFRIASMTKPILATATMILVEDGKLALEDLLTFRMGHGMVFGPTFQPPYPIIAAAEGLQLVMGPPDPRTPHDPDEWIKRFGTLPLMYQPGERWQYNTGALVLSVLVGRASGQPLADFLRTRIFAPLGMKETGFSMSAKESGRLPGYYMTNFQTSKLELQMLSSAREWAKPPAFPSGAAGLLSTVDDYLAFARFLLSEGVHQGERLLSRESVKLMTTNHLTPEQMAGGGPVLAGQGWGFGVSVSTRPDEVSSRAGRYGWGGGYGTSWFNDPGQSLVAIAMTQTSDFLFNGGLSEFEKLAAHS